MQGTAGFSLRAALQADMSALLDPPAAAAVVERLRHRVLGPDSDDRIPVTETEFFDVLADSRRRAVIDWLAEERPDETVSLDELATEVAAAEVHMPIEHVPEARIEAVDDELRQTHVPLLSEVGVVRWDPDAGAVSRGHSFDPVAGGLAALKRRLDPLPPQQRPCQIETTTPSWG